MILARISRAIFAALSGLSCAMKSRTAIRSALASFESEVFMKANAVLRRRSPISNQKQATEKGEQLAHDLLLASCHFCHRFISMFQLVEDLINRESRAIVFCGLLP